MAMIICSECGTEVSDQAITCPKCGVNQNSIAMIEKIKENRQDSCKNNLPNLIQKCDELYKDSWYEGPLAIPLFLLSLALILLYGLGILIIAIFIYLEQKKKKDFIKAASNALPCLKKVYPILDKGILTSKFDYIVRNEKLTEREFEREKMDYMIYSKAYKLGADAIVIDNQNTSTKVSGSVSTSAFSKSVSGSTSSTVFDNVYVSYVKLKD